MFLAASFESFMPTINAIRDDRIIVRMMIIKLFKERDFRISLTATAVPDLVLLIA